LRTQAPFIYFYTKSLIWCNIWYS